VVRIIKQRILLILFLWTFLNTVTVVGTYLQIKYLPVWRAYALVMIEEEAALQALQEMTRFVPQDTMERVLLNEASAMKGINVLEQALLDVEVQSTQWYLNVEKDRRVEELLETLSVYPVEGTSLVRVGMACRHQEDPHRIVNAVVRAYLSIKEEQARAEYRSKMGDYQNEESLLRKQLDEQTEEIARFQGSMSTPGAVSGINIVGQALLATSDLLAQQTAQKLELKAMYETYQNAQDLAVSPQIKQLVESDPAIANLNFRLQALQEEREVAREKFGDRHRQLRQIDARIAAVQEDLDQQRSTRLAEVKDYQIEQARIAYLNMMDQEMSLREKYEQLKAQQRDLDRDLATYEKMLSQHKLNEEHYNEVRAYVNQLQFLLRQRSAVQAKVAQSAVVPLERSSPQWYINVPVGVFLGLLVSVGFALLLDLVDTKIRAPGDIVRHLRLPILGTIPDVDDEEIVIDQVERAVLDTPHSMLAEAFRTVRTNLFFASAPERQRSLAVCSPKPEDGKTTILINLGASIAHSGRRVLLVDANFRRPSLQQVFNSSGEAGLSNVLVGQAKWNSLVRKTSLDNLDYLVAGPAPPNPSELLGSNYLRDFVGQAVTEYDQVLFDTPPLLLVSDALVLATMVDGVILVCRAQANSRGVAGRARDLLARVNAHFLGAVLNAARVRRGGYFREQLRTYYDYLPEEPEPDKPPRALPKSKKSKKGKKKEGPDHESSEQPSSEDKPPDHPGEESGASD
jgi:capsular exopolysaccharide synthesis family protein